MSVDAGTWVVWEHSLHDIVSISTGVIIYHGSCMESPVAHSKWVIGSSLRTRHGGSFLVIDKKDLTVGNGLFLAREVEYQKISQLNVTKKVLRF